jgi:hypothetical protein
MQQFEATTWVFSTDPRYRCTDTAPPLCCASSHHRPHRPPAPGGGSPRCSATNSRTPSVSHSKSERVLHPIRRRVVGMVCNRPAGTTPRSSSPPSRRGLTLTAGRRVSGRSFRPNWTEWLRNCFRRTARRSRPLATGTSRSRVSLRAQHAPLETGDRRHPSVLANLPRGDLRRFHCRSGPACGRYFRAALPRILNGSTHGQYLAVRQLYDPTWLQRSVNGSLNESEMTITSLAFITRCAE